MFTPGHPEPLQCGRCMCGSSAPLAPQDVQTPGVSVWVGCPPQLIHLLPACVPVPP